MSNKNLKRETRYGLPEADQILFNRHYVLGYSYYFRQAKWALEIVNPDTNHVDRKDVFRSDYRIPEKFRADKDVYIGSGFERGHLVASANQIDTEIQNSETFLLSNMCPQVSEFNGGVWKELEKAVRELNNDPKVFETYVISGPLFYFDQEVIMIGDDDPSIKVSLPLPHAFFKSVLTERNTGTFNMWSFIIPNEESPEPLDSFLVETSKVEKISGLFLWDTLKGTSIMNKKNRIRKMWKF
ncbi:DNA/RNA non-specific endonuclease [Winogradskyella sp. A2]|uniref:DNA/RNA non-specific endonuclease n=1 Tax=Winogradskyella sp. A2 TaxID=3366944 RepID=UPI00398C4BCA